MTVKNLMNLEYLQTINQGADIKRTLGRPFCCDLLSIAMSRAPAGCVWVTVMGNMNTLAVASLTEAGCIILAEGAKLDDAAKQKAQEQGITVFATELPVFDVALQIYQEQHGITNI